MMVVLMKMLGRFTFDESPVFVEISVWIPATLLVTYNIVTLSGFSIRTWWNNQRMARINIMKAWFFGFLAILLEILRISDTAFEIKKEQLSSNENPGRFTFNESPIFLPGTTILLVQLTTLVINWFDGNHMLRVGMDVFCSAYLVLYYWPFFKRLVWEGTIWNS